MRQDACPHGSVLDRRERWLIIDGHSFASAHLPHTPDHDPHRPDICIGSDDFHTTRELASLAIEVFREQAFSVALDRLGRATLVPVPNWRAD